MEKRGFPSSSWPDRLQGHALECSHTHTLHSHLDVGENEAFLLLHGRNVFQGHVHDDLALYAHLLKPLFVVGVVIATFSQET